MVTEHEMVIIACGHQENLHMITLQRRPTANMVPSECSSCLPGLSLSGAAARVIVSVTRNWNRLAGDAITVVTASKPQNIRDWANRSFR